MRSSSFYLSVMANWLKLSSHSEENNYVKLSRIDASRFEKNEGISVVSNFSNFV